MEGSILLSPHQVAGVFSPAECERIILIAHSGVFGDAKVTDAKQSHSRRLAQTVWLDEERSADWIFERMLETFARANRDHFRFDLQEFSERMQVALYEMEAGAFFDWHIDTGTSVLSARRKLTMVVQLSENDSYDGGQLETNADGYLREASRSIGSALILPSFMLHRVRPVTRGNRYSLTLWSHGPAFQ